MTVNQIMCPDCGRPPGIGRDTCAACGAILDPAARAAIAPRPGQVSLLADLPLAAPRDAGGWLVAVGGIGATIGFLLPWAPNVIGAGGIESYVDRWGLATITHLPVFVAVLVIGLGAIIPNRLPPWLLIGLVPLVVGGLLLGLAWPYLVGALGNGIGMFLDSASGVALIVGGALRLAPWRHSEAPRDVE